MSYEEKIKLLEEIMDAEEGSLSLDMQLNEIEEWDSLSKLSLIVEAKQNFNKILNAEEIRSFKTIKDICEYLG